MMKGAGRGTVLGRRSRREHLGLLGRDEGELVGVEAQVVKLAAVPGLGVHNRELEVERRHSGRRPRSAALEPCPFKGLAGRIKGLWHWACPGGGGKLIGPLISVGIWPIGWRARIGQGWRKVGCLVWGVRLGRCWEVMMVLVGGVPVAAVSIR